MKKIRNDGFSAVELLLVVVLIGIISFAGWYVYQANKDTDKSLAEAGKASSAAKAKPVSLKEYRNTEYGFSFQYPSTWKLTEDLQDLGRGNNEGTISVTSPYGTEVLFGLDLGGRGGDCWDDEANARTARTCYTTNILSVEKLPTSTNAKPIYFYHASNTEPTRDGGKTTYEIGLGGGDNAYTKTGSTLGAGFFGSVENGKTGSINVNVSSKDDKVNSSDAFFNSKEVKEATPILKSFKLLE